MDSLRVTVQSVRALHPEIRAFTLSPLPGQTLPPFEAGAHVRVRVKGQDEWREYSLIDGVNGASFAPDVYQIAVRRDPAGSGGSAFMHEQVNVGDTLELQPPRNDFPLHAHEGAAVLVAGGIGVTPLVSMAARLCALQRPVRMHYAVRARELAAFADELTALLGERLQLHVDAEAGAPMSATALLASCGAQDHLYVCGPQAMLDAVLAEADACGWPRERIHFELFTAPAAEAGDHPFELVLAQSGRTFTVPADKSVLDVLIANGVDPMFDCQRGECGVCAVAVLEGEIDHRDYVLTPRERAEGNVMQACVSRAKGARLVLDL